MLTKNFLYFFVSLLLFNQCTNKVEESCNPQADAFVKNNQNLITDPGFSSMSNIPRYSRKAVFRFVEPNKRLELWNDRFERLIAENADGLSSLELNHISEFVEYLNKSNNSNLYFESKLTKEKYQKLSEYIEKWALNGIRRFNWDGQYIHYLLSSFDHNYSQFVSKQPSGLSISKGKNNNSVTSSAGGECDCGGQGTNGLWFPECWSFMPCQHATACSQLEWGCGILWLQSCWGTCY
jgi:hypothetical protein